jgi:transposase
VLEQASFAGHVFVFRGKRHDWIKLRGTAVGRIGRLNVICDCDVTITYSVLGLMPMPVFNLVR